MAEKEAARAALVQAEKQKDAPKTEDERIAEALSMLGRVIPSFPTSTLSSHHPPLLFSGLLPRSFSSVPRSVLTRAQNSKRGLIFLSFPL